MCVLVFVGTNGKEKKSECDCPVCLICFLYNHSSKRLIEREVPNWMNELNWTSNIKQSLRFQATFSRFKLYF